MRSAPSLVLLFAVFACADTSTNTTPTAPTSSSSSSGASSSSGTPTGMCGKAGVSPGFATGQTIMVGGSARTYAISVPPSYDASKRFPVVFAFHGDGGTGASTKQGFNFEQKHGDEAIFVYPDGQGKTWDLDTWDSKGNRDMPFIDALVAELKSAFCTDKFFATGFSRGGFFVNHLGCHRGNIFAAIASHGGGGPYDGSGKNYDGMGNLQCPTKPVPALLVIGKSDGLFTDAQKSRTYWSFANGCSAQTSPSVPVPCENHAGCTKPLEWCAIDGLGHRVWTEGAEKSWSFFMASK